MKLSIHPEIIQKYDVSGPRYTSYPPVPNFSPDFQEKDFLTYLQTRGITDKISLYFHFPFCKSLCYYCGCNVVITRNPEIIARYLEFLKKEVLLILSYLPEKKPVFQLHWGGGTPNYLSLQQIEDFWTFLNKNFIIAKEAEISIELDPRTAQKSQLQLLKDLGFNRISFGVQDLNPQVQKAINRIQPEEVIEELYGYARSLGFDSINLDFIYGLPHQNRENFRKNLETILRWKPDRLAFFSYAHVPWIKKHQNLLDTGSLPSPLEKILIFKDIVETLTENGYVYIGLDHFALPEDELSLALQQRTLHRNFQGYTVLSGMDVIAFGITGISQYQNLYVRNKKGLKEYREDLLDGRLPIHDGYIMQFDDVVRRKIIQEIMCNLYLDFQEIAREFSIDFYTYFGESLQKLQPMIQDGLIEIKDGVLRVLPDGRPLIRNVAMAFDAFLLRKQREEKPVYSRTI